MMSTKVCKTCKIDKPLDDFGNLKSSPDGKRRECKECRNAHSRSPQVKAVTKAWRDANKESLREQNKKTRDKHKDRYNAKQRERRKTPDAIQKRKEYRLKNADTLRAKQRMYYHKTIDVQRGYNKKRYDANPEYFRQRAKDNRVKFKDTLDAARNRWYMEQYNSNPLFKAWEQLASNLRNRINKNNQSTEDLIGYNREVFMDKVGLPMDGYELDHKIPVTWFDEYVPNIVYHWGNLHYIPKDDNRVKGARWAHPVSLEYFNIAKKYLKPEYLTRFEVIYDNVVDTLLP